MKVLQINAVYGFKSTGVIVKDIGDTLVKNGDEAYFAYQTATGFVKNGYLVGGKIDWKRHALHARVFGKQAYGSKRATKRLLRWMDEIKPDVVHLHNLHSHYIHLPLLCNYLAKKNIATVITLHDCWFFTGKCTHYTTVKCNKWQTGCGNCPQLKEDIPSWFFDCTAKMWKEKKELFSAIPRLAVIGCSEWILNEFKKVGWKTQKSDVVYNGVDTNIFTPHINNFKEKNGIKDEFLILGMADKWGAEQNRKLVKKLIATQTENVKIIIVGCSDQQKTYFKQFSNVIPLGFISERKRLASIYASADVFINLTRADTLPTVNMESICCGTPVITFDCCGSPELIDDDSGFIIQEENFEELLSKIEYLKEKPILFDIAEKQKKFNKNECYKKYLDIYKNISEKKE